MQPVDAGLAGAGRGLVRRRRPARASAELAVQRAERAIIVRRRAVRVGDDAPWGGSRPPRGLTSGTTSGTSGSIRKAPELSTTTAPLRGRDRRPLGGDLVGDVEHRDVDAVEDLRRERLRPRPPRRARRAALPAERGRRRGGSRPRRPRAVDRIVEHHRADGAGRADDGEGGLAPGRCGHRPVLRRPRPRPRSDVEAEGRVRPRGRRRRRWSSRVTTEMRISEVEIISMLTPASASASKKVAVTPGWSACPRRPGTSCRSGRRSAATSKPTSALTCASASMARGRRSSGQREGDVGQAGRGRGDVLHDHVDVDLGVGDAPEDRGGLAGLVRARRRP